MHCVRLIERSAVDADAEICSGCKGDSSAGPEEEETHGPGDYGGYTKGYG